MECTSDVPDCRRGGRGDSLRCLSFYSARRRESESVFRLLADCSIRHVKWVYGGPRVGNYDGCTVCRRGRSVSTSQENAAKVTKSLVEFGFDGANVSPQLFRRKNNVFRMGVPPLQIDILTDVSGVTFNACYKKRAVAEIDGVEVNIISLKDLRKNKRASGRHKDLDDLENLPDE